MKLKTNTEERTAWKVENPVLPRMALMMCLCDIDTLLAEVARLEARVKELEVGLERISTNPDYTNPEGLVRIARAALKGTNP